MAVPRRLTGGSSASGGPGNWSPGDGWRAFEAIRVCVLSQKHSYPGWSFIKTSDKEIADSRTRGMQKNCPTEGVARFTASRRIAMRQQTGAALGQHHCSARRAPPLSTHTPTSRAHLPHPLHGGAKSAKGDKDAPAIFEPAGRRRGLALAKLPTALRLPAPARHQRIP